MNIFQVFTRLRGYRTYVVGVGSVMAGVAPVLQTGELGQLNMELVSLGLGLIFLRKGSKNDRTGT